MAVKLGSKCKDTLTGFAGIAVVRSEHLYGCVHVAIQPQELGRDGQTIAAEYFDEQRVEVLEELTPTISSASSATSGGNARIKMPIVSGFLRDNRAV
jgi:phosphohistidine swiveling domain-containing protein